MRTRDFVIIASGVFTSVAALACFSLLSNLELPRERPMVRIRVVNQTGRDFQQVVVGLRRNFGALESGAASRYHYFTGVSDNISVEARTGEHVLRSPGGCGNVDDLPAGSYTCTV